MSRLQIDLSGRRFGRMLVIRYDGQDHTGHSMFLCRCDCGAEKTILSESLRTRTSFACVCDTSPERRAAWFWAGVEKTEGCWLWRRFIDDKGYGVIGRQGRAHRIAWTLTNGAIADGLDVLHRCDVPACVRPDHLFLGTQADNNADMYAKGRAVNLRGEQHGSAKLTEAQVREIRSTYERDSATRGYQALARHYGVSKRAIDFIVNRRNWRHIA